MIANARRSPLGLSLTLLLVLAASVPAAWAAGAQTPADLAGLAGWRGAAPNSPDAFSFVVMGDRTGGHAPGAWEAAVAEINLLRPDFVICVGDLVEGYEPDERALEAQWDEIEGYTVKLAAPFFYCPGNHDVLKKDPKSTENVSRRVYLRRHAVEGRAYYSFDYRGCHFVVLDSTEAGGNKAFAEEQLQWLAKDLEAAREAKHLFLFYHHPSWSNKTLWPRMRALLPAGKTTTFNGHWHNLDYHLEEGIPTYVLACTAANTDPRALRLSGGYRMYARVAVDAGQPTVALIPLHQIEPGGRAAEVAKAKAMMDWSAAPLSVGPGGGTVALQPANLLDAPVKVAATWRGEGWRVSPATAEATLEGGATGSLSFNLRRGRPDRRPVLLAEVTFPTGEKLTREMPVAVWRQGVLAKLDTVALDGKLDEWKGIPTLALDTRAQVRVGEKTWKGPKDSSCRMRAAVRGTDLVIAVDALDDAYLADHTDAWMNDAIELFWDVRPPAARDGKAGLGTGQVIFVVPDADGPAKSVLWKPAGRDAAEVPTAVKSAFRRTAGGYTLEVSLPLSEAGLQSPPAPGEEIGLDLMQDDRDPGLDPEKPTWTAKSSAGVGDLHLFTGAYARFRVR